MRAFTGFLSPPILFPLVSCCAETSLAPRGGVLHDRDQHPIIPQPNSTFLLFLSAFSHSHVFFSFGVFLPAQQHCSLMFTYSLIQNNKLKLCSLQPAHFFLITHFCLPAFTDAFSPVTHGPHNFSVKTKRENAGHRGNKMTHWKYYCW